MTDFTVHLPYHSHYLMLDSLRLVDREAALAQVMALWPDWECIHVTIWPKGYFDPPKMRRR